MVLRAHHQTLDFQAHQKSSGFYLLTTNTCIQFRDGQNLFKVYKFKYKIAPLEHIKYLKQTMKLMINTLKPFQFVFVEALAP